MQGIAKGRPRPNFQGWDDERLGERMIGGTTILPVVSVPIRCTCGGEIWVDLGGVSDCDCGTEWALDPVLRRKDP